MSPTVTGVTATQEPAPGYNYRRANYAVPEAPGGQGPQPDEHNLFIGVAIDRAFSDQQRTMVSFEAGTSVFNVTVADRSSPGQRPAALRVRRRRGASDREELAAPGILRSREPVQPGLRRAGLRGRAVCVRDRVPQRPCGHHGVGGAYGGRVRVLATWHGRFTTTTAGARLRYALSRNWALDGPVFSLFVRLHQLSRRSVPDRRAASDSRATACGGGVSVFLPISPR